MGGRGDRAVQREGDKAGLLSPLPSTFVLSSFPIPRQALPSESRGLGRGEGSLGRAGVYGREKEEIPDHDREGGTLWGQTRRGSSLVRQSPGQAWKLASVCEW